MARWKKAEIAEIHAISPTTKRFILNIESEEPFSFKAGQFVTLDLPIGEKRLDRWRSYSISSAPSQDNTIELCIVEVENGRASKYLFHEAGVGTELKLKGPGGAFCLPEELKKPSVFICTGTGVAPFTSMLLELKKRAAFNKPVHLIFGTRVEEGILYKSLFEQLAVEEPNFSYDVCLSRADDSWKGQRGYVHEIYKEKYAIRSEEVDFYLCGWSNMVDQAVDILKNTMQVSESNIFHELYG
jgi:ferredoxin-NADP reductase